MIYLLLILSLIPQDEVPQAIGPLDKLLDRIQQNRDEQDAYTGKLFQTLGDRIEASRQGMQQGFAGLRELIERLKPADPVELRGLFTELNAAKAERKGILESLADARNERAKDREEARRDRVEDREERKREREEERLERQREREQDAKERREWWEKNRPVKSFLDSTRNLVISVIVLGVLFIGYTEYRRVT